MANRLGLSFPAYYKNESGETFPRQATLIRLEKEYDISMDWYIFGKGEMYYGKERDRIQALERESGALKEELETLKQELETTREKLSIKEKEPVWKGWKEFGVERKEVQVIGSPCHGGGAGDFLRHRHRLNTRWLNFA